MIKALFRKIFGSGNKNNKPPIDHLDQAEGSNAFGGIGNFRAFEAMDPESAHQAELMNAAPLQETMAELEALADEISHESDHQMSAEDMCGITPEMTPEAVKTQLAALYRRYNRSASSLNGSLREEAESMLTAIVKVRENMEAKG